MIKLWQKDKEDLEEVSNELELADEDDKVPYTVQIARMLHMNTNALQIQNW